MQQHYSENNFNSSDNWILLNPIETSIKNKIEQYGTPLSEWNIQINYGIKTGYNDAFIIDESTKNALIASDPKSEELIRPILRGKDIKRYTYNFANLWLIYIPWHFPLHNDPNIKGASVKAEEEFKKQYPAIYSYLEGHKEKLSKRNKAETGIRYEWYALQRWGSNYSDDFFERNIAWQRITHENTFCLTKENTVILDSMAFINGAKEKTYYLLAVLNSNLVKFWMKKNVPEYGSTGYRFSNQFVTQIPVPLFVEEKELAKINDYVKEYFEGKDTSNVINEFVFRIFKLTKEEIKYIDFRKLSIQSIITDDFNKPKLMYSEIVQEPHFYYDDNTHFYPEATTFIMNGDNLKSLLLILNSKLTFNIFKLFYAGGGLGENGIRYKKAFLLNLRLPKLDETANSILESYYEMLLVNNFQMETCCVILNEVENYISKLYNLSQSEIDYLLN
ncbi:TaqI-like C-terminal specificity domain-containing protein [Holdemanella biformis]|uniref:TaqI-like C-terminal specificity domain-containing protein n=1 Tax=Holdemanella biformis TaxID=1735 RepID=UPI0022E34D87|nr:TaqI-like C-terminal specificity domain-containing protein [Holdemanella biformis]